MRVSLYSLFASHLLIIICRVEWFMEINANVQHNWKTNQGRQPRPKGLKLNFFLRLLKWYLEFLWKFLLGKGLVRENEERNWTTRDWKRKAWCAKSCSRKTYWIEIKFHRFHSNHFQWPHYFSWTKQNTNKFSAGHNVKENRLFFYSLLFPQKQFQRNAKYHHFAYSDLC